MEAKIAMIAPGAERGVDFVWVGTGEADAGVSVGA